MSQVTSQYGDTLINGLLAGMKYRAQNEELQIARLQRAEWEAGAGHRQLMEQLQGQTAQLGLSRQKTGLQIDELQRQQLALELEKTPERINTGINRDKAAIRSSEVQTAFTEDQRKEYNANAPVVRRQNEAAARKAELDARGAELDQYSKLTVKSGFTWKDAESLAVAFEAKGEMPKMFLANYFMTQAEESQKEVRTTQDLVSKSLLDQASFLATKGDGGIQAFQELYKDDPRAQEIAALAKGMQPQAEADRRIPTEREDAFTKATGESLAKELASLRTQITTNQAKIRELKATETPDPDFATYSSFDSTDAKRQVEHLERENAILEEQAKQIRGEAQGNKPTGKIVKQTPAAKTGSGKPLDVNGVKQFYQQWGGVDKNADPDTIVQFLTAQGYVVDRKTVLEAQGKKGK